MRGSEFTMNFDAILLASGGMDSTVLAHYLNKEKVKYFPLFLNYGQHCKDTEYERLINELPKNQIKNVVSLDISGIYLDSQSRLIKEPNLWEEEVSYQDLYIPYRNLMFLTIAAAYAQSRKINKVYAAFINSNHVLEIDCSVDFFNNLQSLLDNIGSVEIELPFRDMTKFDVCRLGISLGLDITKTFSCQVNSKIHCGVCPNCVDRLEALEKVVEE